MDFGYGTKPIIGERERIWMPDEAKSWGRDRQQMQAVAALAKTKTLVVTDHINHYSKELVNLLEALFEQT